MRDSGWLWYVARHNLTKGILLHTWLHSLTALNANGARHPPAWQREVQDASIHRRPRPRWRPVVLATCLGGVGRRRHGREAFLTNPERISDESLSPQPGKVVAGRPSREAGISLLHAGQGRKLVIWLGHAAATEVHRHGLPTVVSAIHTDF